MNIQKIPNALTIQESALILDKLFKAKALWELRPARSQTPYRDSTWYTLGTPLYLDGFMTPELFYPKVTYMNDLLTNIFNSELLHFMEILEKKLQTKVEFLANVFSCSLPGFHIFPSNPSLFYFFGNLHRDLQWEGLFKSVNFPFRLEDVSEHLSFTLPLMLPYQGGGLIIGNQTAKLNYEVNTLYIHNGAFTHAIAPYGYPVLPTDHRITLQAHGFTVKGTTYIYW